MSAAEEAHQARAGERLADGVGWPCGRDDGRRRRVRAVAGKAGVAQQVLSIWALWASNRPGLSAHCEAHETKPLRPVLQGATRQFRPVLPRRTVRQASCLPWQCGGPVVHRATLLMSLVDRVQTPSVPEVS